MSKRVHMASSISGMLRLSDEELRGWCHDDDGRLLEPHEVRAELVRLQAEGKKVIPYGGCDHQDAEGYCLGHEDPEPVPAPAQESARSSP